MEQIANIARPCDVPDTGLLCDILWADPDPSITVSILSCSAKRRLGVFLLFRSLLDTHHRDGARTIVVFPSPLVATLFDSSFVGTIWTWWFELTKWWKMAMNSLQGVNW